MICIYIYIYIYIYVLTTTPLHYCAFRIRRTTVLLSKSICSAEGNGADGRINGLKPFIKTDKIPCRSAGDIDKLEAEADAADGVCFF